MSNKDYIPIYPHVYKNFKGRNLIKTFFELDYLDSHNHILYMDFCLEFEPREDEFESEDNYYTPYKFELDYKLFNLSDEEFKQLAIQKMLEIKVNIESYIRDDAQDLIYKNRIIEIKSDEH